MIEIRRLDTYDKSIVKEIVNIHMHTFTGFFLTFMGKGFLQQMYSSYISHADSGIYVASLNGKTIGFLSYSKNMSNLYKFMIKKKLISFAWYSLGAFFRKPKAFMRIIRAFLKPGESRREEKYVELSSIGVLPEEKTKGVGSLLISKLKENVDYNQYEYISLETDADNNVAANKFYLKNGFKLVKEYQTREGRKMNEYRYRKEKDE